jgi:hypothetical protein
MSRQLFWEACFTAKKIFFPESKKSEEKNEKNEKNEKSEDSIYYEALLNSKLFSGGLEHQYLTLFPKEQITKMQEIVLDHRFI